MRYHFTPMRQAHITKNENNQCWHECSSFQKRNSQPLLVRMLHDSTFWKQYGSLKKNKPTELPYDSAVPLLDTTPKGPKTVLQSNLLDCHCSALHNTQVSKNRWLCKEIMVHIHNRILPSSKGKNVKKFSKGKKITGF